MPSTNTHSDLAAALACTALRAGRKIMAIYAGDFSVERKGDDTPVTDADRQAEEIILADLAKIAPAIPVISEEASGGRGPQHAPQRFFLVDPLDGTREFVSRNGEFTVNVALIENGAPVAGVVLAPAVGRLFVAGGPGAAFEMSFTGDTPDGFDPARARPIATARPDPTRLRVVASRSHRDAETEAWLRTINAGTLVAAGSSLKFCLIAAGEADVYPRFGRTMEWDTAAGQAVLQAAGGVVTTLEGTPLRYGKADRGWDNPPFIAWGRAEAVKA